MDERVLFGHEALARTVRRLALEVVDRTRGAEGLALVGILRGGVPAAQALQRAIQETAGKHVPLGQIEIALYRDDAATAIPDAGMGTSRIDFGIDGRDVVLVDDVLETGRTVRAAIDCLLDYGRPRRVWLAALFDRGGRELPVAPDFVGQVIHLERDEALCVDFGARAAAVVQPRRPR